MKAFCFRLEDEVAERLDFAAQRAGLTKYTYIINTLLQRLNDEEEMAKKMMNVGQNMRPKHKRRCSISALSVKC